MSESTSSSASVLPNFVDVVGEKAVGDIDLGDRALALKQEEEL